MRRLPVYIMIDSSGSMRGEPIEAVRVGLQALAASLRTNPYALETVWLSVITFDLHARTLVPLREVDGFTIPAIPTPQTSPTNLGEALMLLLNNCRAEVKFTTANEKGDWKPLLIIMTDGAPSDVFLFKRMAEQVRKYPFAKIICCAAGPKAKVEPLRALTDEIYSLETLDRASFAKFWDWVSVTVENETNAAAGRQNLQPGEISLDLPPIEEFSSELPPPPDEIRIV